MSNNFDIVEALWLRKEKKRRAQKIIEGAPPLTYTAKNAGTLKNYRIYGQTVDGESVGDRTGNLFDYVTMSEGLTGTYINADGDELANGGWNVTNYIPCDGTVFTLNVNPYTGNLPAICLYDGNKNYITGAAYSNSSTITVRANQNAKYIRFSYSNSYDLSVVMLNSGSTALPYEPYGYKVPVKIEGKNLLQNTATTQTLGADDTHAGITFTVNNDGSIIVNGSSESAQSFKWEMDSITVGTQIILSGCPSGGGDNKHRLDIRNASLQALAADSGNGATYTITGVEKYTVIRIAADYVCDNLTFYPMIRRAEIADGTYEPYQTPVTTNLYLPEQIRKVGNEAEYIDYGEQKQHFVGGTSVDVTLPALPTIAGTNTLSVGTQVQPSKVMTKGKLKE